LTESPSLKIAFAKGGILQLLHLQHSNDVLDHQGKEYAFVGFDELTHFERSQMWYMVSRMRTMSGVRAYMRCTTNPDPDSFVAELIAWWIDQETGLPVPERSGLLRWFIRRGDELMWADTREELLQFCIDGEQPLSLTFIHARLSDNPALEKADPGYRARLMALPEVERERLMGGNWKVRADGGRFIRREFFEDRYTLPPESLSIFGASDYGVSEAADGKNPDFTEHGIFGVGPDDRLYVLDWWYGQTTADVWIDAKLDMMAKWKPLTWFGEGGVIRKSVEPFLNKRMMERRVYCSIEWINHVSQRGQGSSKQGFADASKRAKAVRARSFQARAAQKRIVFPADAPWAGHVIDQCVGFPNGKDDAFDVMALINLVIDEMHPALSPTEVAKKQDRWAEKFKRGNDRDWRTA
jgi:predicted phage terminase large subunit-like protein